MSAPFCWGCNKWQNAFPPWTTLKSLLPVGSYIPLIEQEFKKKHIDDFRKRLLRVIGGSNATYKVQELKAYDVIQVRPSLPPCDSASRLARSDLSFLDLTIIKIGFFRRTTRAFSRSTHPSGALASVRTGFQSVTAGCLGITTPSSGHSSLLTATL